jgi:DNA repair protein RadA/Sms
VPGSLVLVGGEPGIGKSTLLLQVADAVSAARPVMIVCGEESAAQVRIRAERICRGGLDRIGVLAETELETVVAAVDEERPAVVVVDSVQTLYAGELSSAPGSVSQVREAAGRFLRLAKDSGVAVFLVGHVTKDGAIAGPRVLEHMVDTVLQFEGDRDRFFRVLRAAKNRFGSTNELGVFEMTEGGLLGVDDPSRLFLSEQAPAAGSCVHVAVEGTRCFLVEVQALVSKSELAMPRRVATGFDRNRLAMILAVLSRHAKLALASSDIFVNIAGGMRIEEPAADLAVALAIASAERGVPLPGTASFGEISLTGELRSSSQPGRRHAEAERVGLGVVLMPRSDARRVGEHAPDVVGLADVRAAVGRVGGPAARKRDVPRSADARED